MKGAAKGPTDSAIENIDKGFARDAYKRVADLIGMVQACNNLVMVGCGAFPATLFWLRDHFPGARYTGLDTDARCVETATKLAEAMGIEMSFNVIDGSDYNFAGADFVYVANQVVPKKAVLQQVARSGNVTRVVVREPTRKGELLAEAVRYDLPEEFVVESEGVESPIFLSYDLLLRRV
jgi:trans-aconitate methyltransferase